MSNYFVTAIHTDSGKTVVSSILALAWNCDYWKPVQSGEPADSDTVRQMTNGDVHIHQERFKLKTPASPHYAAEIDDVKIALEDFNIPKTNRSLIIEGAGGLLVPLNDHDLMIDLIKKLSAEVILVSNNYLGSINHTLLSLEAIKSRNLPLKYLVFNGPPTPSTESIIEKKAEVPVLFRLPQVDGLSTETIRKYADIIRKSGT